MRRTRWLLVTIALVAMLASIRVHHVRLGWGGYWEIEFAPPWRR